MNIGTFFKVLLSREDKFYRLFEEDAENLSHMAQAFCDLMRARDSSERDEAIKKIKEYELSGDNITLEIYSYLNTMFMTPIDREDIHSLAIYLEDMANNINDAGQRILLYKPKLFIIELSTLSDLILAAVVQIKRGIKDIQKLKKMDTLTKTYIEVKKIQNQAEDLYNQAISNLFEKEADSVELIKLKDILESVEKAINKAKDISDVFKAIVSKQV